MILVKNVLIKINKISSIIKVPTLNENKNIILDPDLHIKLHL